MRNEWIVTVAGKHDKGSYEPLRVVVYANTAEEAIVLGAAKMNRRAEECIATNMGDVDYGGGV